MGFSSQIENQPTEESLFKYQDKSLKHTKKDNVAKTFDNAVKNDITQLDHPHINKVVSAANFVHASTTQFSVNKNETCFILFYFITYFSIYTKF